MPSKHNHSRLVDHKTVILIDDDDVMIEVIKHLLTEAGFKKVHGFLKPTEALELLNYVKPDLIITDIHMPHLSGTFFAKLVSDFPHLSTVPLLAITADDTEETKKLAQQNGIMDIAYKPINPNTLLAKVYTALELGEHSKRVRSELRNLASADASAQEDGVFDLFGR